MNSRGTALRHFSLARLGSPTGCKGSIQQQVAAWFLRLTLKPDVSLDEIRRAYRNRPTPVPAPVTRAINNLCDVQTRASAKSVVLCGDSAGGNLALTHAMHFRDRGLPPPSRVILFSPWLDVTLANPNAKAIESKDIMLRVDRLREMGKWWAGSADPRMGIISPIYGDLRGLPPIDIYQGTEDILLPDSRHLHDLVNAAGGISQLYETPAGFHVFMGATFTPEAKKVFRQIAQDMSAI